MKTNLTPKSVRFQLKQLEKLRESKEYQEASIYTVLLDLCEGNDVDDVFLVLHNVATDLGKREDLENAFDRAKKWEWNSEEN